ncbi:hypothetical protein APE_0826a [Aeropyrum pernix spindle-shaped virus 1]|uniref:Uncharacterized protein n=1 Tax=Aeropyrum pernix (strain ATCC 700893 / DSM 11879 / JCM 9820 / NBRC 100138 / K1) TaxID=272557 RepID=Q9YDU1_AERPE|nr:hypothetical protein APE_0826a [Aeropyrum pernix spindle-shaped virus 1] [Aeropyrum pernix K1]
MVLENVLGGFEQSFSNTLIIRFRLLRAVSSLHLVCCMAHIVCRVGWCLCMWIGL